ncbi:ABC transporter permease [Pandoraea cepalis]|uniref:ABC transporter permease n=1 Tax=Pandoraea cepalis TaxID=2508294 RepID=A0AAW7MHX5_9BURK|nr:TRAP transporter large permease subunit [Pandoraea cepalis]MDN4572256.1 ABC transporter permease [Pandoraea cepalis]MDN4576863.1 ABC transporter permease [Pandoraea cepalis]
MRVCAFVAGLLVIFETLLLLAGVIARYELDNPITWADELAQVLFIWLSMLGAALALHRGEHMRLTNIVNRLPSRWRGVCEALAQLIVCLFVALTVTPAYLHAIEQHEIMTPALEIPGSVRAWALPVGVGFMLISAITKLAGYANARQLLSALAVVTGIGVALWLARPALLAVGNLNLLVFFVAVVGASILAGVPIAFAFGVATLGYLTLGTDVPLQILVSRMEEGMSGLILLSVPLFVLLGALIEMTGLAASLVTFMGALLGHMRGGLHYVLLVAMFLVSGISGAKAADMAAVAPALLPEMKRRGERAEDLVALLAATGAMTETIPPSLVLITIGSVCSVSITALFIGGLMPAVVATFAIVAVCAWQTLRHRGEASAPMPRASLSVIVRTFVLASPALALPIFIRTAVVEGAATATEVSTLGIVYTLIYGCLSSSARARLRWQRVRDVLTETAALTGAILLIIGMATAMAWALTQSGFSTALVTTMRTMPGGATGFLLTTMVVFVLLGSILEGIPAIVLFGPLLFPVARSLGIHDVHYAMIVILAMGVGLFAPPLGVGFYAACSVGKAAPDDVMPRVWPYLGALIVALTIVAFFPWFSIGWL